MKKIFTAIFTFLLMVHVYSQSPEKMSYQAVIRNSDNQLITNQLIGMQISILQGTEMRTSIYNETQTANTNSNGLISIEIGTGITNDDFSSIDWANGPFYIKIETDPNGGSNYSIVGISQLLSVPYALYVNENDPTVSQGSELGELQYWDGTAWRTIAPGSEGSVLTIENGVPKWKLNGNDEIEFVVNPVTGRTWMDRNLGATRVATSSDDEAAFGFLYQWGRSTDGHQIRTSNTNSNLSSSDTPNHNEFITVNNDPYDWRSPQNDNLWQGINGINNPCPAGYRIPTVEEWEDEINSWSSNDLEGAYNSPLKLPAAGSRYVTNGELSGEGTSGYYWASSIDNDISQSMGFLNGFAHTSSNYRGFALSVRCIKD